MFCTILCCTDRLHPSTHTWPYPHTPFLPMYQHRVAAGIQNHSRLISASCKHPWFHSHAMSLPYAATPACMLSAALRTFHVERSDANLATATRAKTIYSLSTCPYVKLVAIFLEAFHLTIPRTTRCRKAGSEVVSAYYHDSS
jgi:hypothetical protein